MNDEGINTVKADAPAEAAENTVLVSEPENTPSPEKKPCRARYIH